MYTAFGLDLQNQHVAVGVVEKCGSRCGREEVDHADSWHDKQGRRFPVIVQSLRVSSRSKYGWHHSTVVCK
jgi:hypothetical protein